MAIVKQLELKIRPGSTDVARALFQKILGDTRNFEGNLGVEVMIDKSDETHWILRETWETLEHDKAYAAWRATPDGAIEGFGDVLAGAPSSTYFELAQSL